MRLSELISCAMCLRATRDWRHLEVREDGATVWTLRCCRACTTQVEDAVKREIQDTRLSAVRS